MKLARPDAAPSPSSRDSEGLKNVLGLVCAWSARLSESEVVVRRHIERLGRLAREGEACVVVGRSAVEEGCGAACDRRDGTSKAVVDAELESATARVLVRREGQGILNHS